MPLILANKADEKKWNKIVENDPQGNFFDRFEWNNSLGKISNNIEALPLYLEDESKVGVFPCCLVKNLISVTMESLPFTDYGGGTLYRSKYVPTQSTLLKKINNDLINIALKNRCIKISIRRAYQPDIINKDNINKPFFIDNNSCTFIISYEQGIDHVYKEISSDRRKAIKRSERKGTIVREATEYNDLCIFYKIYASNMDKFNRNHLPFIFYKTIWDIFVSNDKGKIFIAEYKDKPIGGILLLNYKGICHGWSNGMLYDYQDKRPIDVLNWHSIKWAFDNNFKLFDMGTTINDPSSGLYFYKKSWGGEKKTLYNYHIIVQPKKWKFLNQGNKLFNNIKNIFPK